MKRTSYISLILFLFFITALRPATGQLRVPTLMAQNQPSETAPRIYDPLRRETPRGAVLAFLDAVHRDDYATAAQYMQLPPGKPKTATLELARELGVLMDLKYQGRSVTLSDQPEGVLTDSYGPERERIGRIPAEEGNVDVFLVRVESANGVPIWLFSRDFVDRVPELFEQVEVPAIARWMPGPLASHKFLSLSVGQWIGWLLAIPASVMLGVVVLALFHIPIWTYRKLKHKSDDRTWKKRYMAPVLMLVSTAINWSLTYFLGIPLPHRGYYIRVLMVLLLVGVGWLTLRIIETTFEGVRLRAVAIGYGSTTSYLVLTQRLVRVLAVIVIGLLIFGSLGFETKTALAGLGIGGLAIALAAQKTLENLLGGVSLLVDNVVRVGDTCRVGTQVGTVTDIGLRSIAIKTVEQTNITIPNGMLASQQFENLTGRTKYLVKTTLGLQYETSVEQLQRVLAEIRELLQTHPKVEHESARVRFVALGQSSLDLELFAYIATKDYAEYLAIQEELLFAIMKIIEANGTAFAYPVRRMIVEQAGTADELAARAAASSGT